MNKKRMDKRHCGIIFLLFIFWGISNIQAEVKSLPEALFVSATDSSYVLRQPDSVFLTTFRADKAFNYAAPLPERPGWFSRFIQWLRSHFLWNTSSYMDVWLGRGIIIIAVLLVIFLIYKLIRNEYGSPIAQKDQKFAIEGVTMEENTEGLSLVEIAEKTAAEGKYSLAVRMHYINILHLMHEKGFVSWDPHKTNQEYLYEIQDIKIRSMFQKLSRVFDYICYGEFSIDERLYQKVALQFKKFREGMVK